MKRLIAVMLLCSMCIGGLTGCDRITGDRVYVYNWGEYIDPEVNKMFEKETGIKVIYEEYETNEVMYPRVNSGAVQYDAICPSDYMVQRMREEGLLQKLDKSKIPNLKYIGEDYLESSKSFDPTNDYSVPYCWGTVGILYNKKLVDEKIDSWSVLFDEKYKNEILMIDSVRDALGIALKYKGYSLNSKNKSEIKEAQQLLLDQKPLVQSYVVDQVRDMMIGGEAKIGVIYSGEAIYTQRENPDLEYVVPKEGSNVWIDSWVIPKNAPNKEFAEKYINFLCRPDIAKLNFDYITYSTPNTGARDLIEDDAIKNSTIAFPSSDILKKCETYNYLGKDMDDYYLSRWKEVKGK
ncbi:ABC transporter, periplasmic spermidine putrescine-binding protein PotD [Lachnospiraceae bacterium KM106-2]|nr:ABC transporter, periplasmic spermidine putrescine-binding protein PotD [Lachnospiraceae bacterium KM106-2]